MGLLDSDVSADPKFRPNLLWQATCKFIESFCVGNVRNEGSTMLQEVRRMPLDDNLAFLQRFSETSMVVCESVSEKEALVIFLSKMGHT